MNAKSENSARIAALDIGGTFIKSGVWDGAALRELPPVPVNSNAGREDILASLSTAILNALGSDGASVDGVGICIPGPFDYARGISLMKHKFASIEGADLGAELRRAAPSLANVPIKFRHDADSFLAGEIKFGNGAGCKRLLGVTLGTGIGVTASFDGVCQLNQLGSPVPEIGLWNKPFKGGTVEDWISTRALVKQYSQKLNSFDTALGVKGIADDARRGEPEALAVFAELGRNLNAVLSAHAERHSIERIILGGQISNAFDLFGPALQEGFPKNVELKLSKLGGKAMLLGAIASLLRPS